MSQFGWRLPFDVCDLTYDEALAHVHSLLRFGICPMLETVVDMLCALGNPDLVFDCIQIAGTNGKTSTSRYTAAILAGEGLRVALYTSPELVSYTERMEVCGVPVSKEIFAHGVSAAREAGLRVNERRRAAGERPWDITAFDTLTVAALVVFAEAGVDVAVLECGMGGRWDATTAAKSIRTVGVTGIGLDHTRILGDTLEAIAGEKAAIIASGRACVLGAGTATPDSVEDVFLARCHDEGVVPVLVRPQEPEDAAGVMQPGVWRAHADLPYAAFVIDQRPHALGSNLEVTVLTPRATYTGLTCIKPSYQAANIAQAVTLAEVHLGHALDIGALRESVARCPTPGRFQVLSQNPLVLIDAAHNPQSVEVFLSAMDAVAPDRATRPTLLAAVLADKDVEGIVSLLAAGFPRVVCTQTTSPRALPADDLASAFRRADALVLGTYDTVAMAASALCGESYVACGSITLAGELAAIIS